MTKELVDKLTFTEIQVDPKFYKHIIGKNGANVNRLKDELEVTINISENDGRNIIRIEGSKEGVDTTKQVKKFNPCNYLSFLIYNKVKILI